jgi:hypothetical protein
VKEEITKGFKGECVPLVSGAREKVLCGFEPVPHIGFKQLKPSFFKGVMPILLDL